MVECIPFPNDVLVTIDLMDLVIPKAELRMHSLKENNVRTVGTCDGIMVGGRLRHCILPEHSTIGV